jgi:DNA repair exonuclease SbcCD ATPase subunit
MVNRNNGDSSDIEYLRQQSERLLAQKDKDIEGMRSKLDAVQIEVAKLEKEVDKWKAQVAKLQADLEASKHQLQNQHTVLQNQDRALAQCQSNLRFSQSRNEEIDALLKKRTAELEGAQTFLSKADLISDADATWKVQALNTELCQAASFIADEFEAFSGNKRSAKKADVVSIDDSTGIDLPSLMIEALKSADHLEDPINLMLALQIVMVQRCKSVIEAWIPGDQASNQAFKTIYRSLHSTRRFHKESI